MQFTQSVIALLTASSLVSAAPRFSKRQSSCSTTYGCPFEITVAGCTTSQIVDGQVRVANSSISEISDGQARCDLNGTTPANFTLSNGQVTDSSGRVCEISNQDQFQCSATPDTGATTTGFSVCNGLLTFNGNSSFVACLATGDIPGYNIYTSSVDRSTVTDCMAIELDVPACAVATSSCVPSTTTATVISTVTPAAVTVDETQTVTAAPVTVTATATLPAVTDTVTATATATLPAVTNTVTATATATLPAITNTVTATATLPAVTNTVTATATQPAQTVTVTVTSVSAVAQTTVAPVSTTTSAAQTTCTNISRSLGSSNFPNTIEVVNESSDVSGSSYFAYIGSGNSTIFTFNSVGSSGECSVNFYFPTEAEIVAAGGTTSYDISASSIAVTLYELESVAAVTDTYATKPARGASFSATLTPGTNTTFTSLTCPSSQTSYELVATDSNTLSFFEDYNLPVLGLVVASC